jgi:hypothetical protein
MVRAMTNDQLPRLRRLLPAAVAAITLATSAPFVAPAVSQAESPKTHATPPGKIAALPRTPAIRGIRVQGNGTTG